MPHRKSVCSLLITGLIVMVSAGSGLTAQDDEVARLKQEIAQLRKDIKEIHDFQRRLCKALRDESIVIFATTPRTEEEKVVRVIEEFKAAINKANQAMASRNPFLNQRADELRQKAEEKMKKMKPELIIPALKAEVEAATNDFMMCSALMMALANTGKEAVFPYVQNICEDKKRPGFVRRIGAEALLAINKDKAIDVLIPVCSDFSEPKKFPERFYVIYMLSETKDPRVEPMLIRGAKLDPDKSARCHHINGLANYKTAEARATLEWVMAHDDYEYARTNALASLHRMLGDEAAYPLMKRLSQTAMMKDGKTPDYRVRNAAYQAMNRIKLTLQRAGKPIPGETPPKKKAEEKKKKETAKKETAKK